MDRKRKPLLDGASLLITGGTGSFGKAFVRYVLRNFKLRRLCILSRDEFKQHLMKSEFPKEKYPQIRYFLGDVRDYVRLRRAFEGVDYVIHAAALKQVPAAEENPLEFIKTNIQGAQNVIEAAIDTNVTKVVALSTDKACSPCNLYGATKLVSDKLFLSANNIRGSRDLGFSVVRYGNVLNSRGSVVEIFKSQLNSSHFTITDPSMTRFLITLDEGVVWVCRTLLDLPSNILLVPKLPSIRITDLAVSMDKHKALHVIGLRPGEKMHEEMIGEFDQPNVLEATSNFVITTDQVVRQLLLTEKDYREVPKPFKYDSLSNAHYLNINEIDALLKGAGV